MIISCDGGESGVGGDCGCVGVLAEVGMVSVSGVVLVEVGMVSVGGVVLVELGGMEWTEAPLGGAMGEGVSPVLLSGPEVARERWTMR